MNIENLKQNPFFLTDDDVNWVESTLKAMTDDEKIGQLFFMVGYRQDEEFLTHLSKDLGVGGLMCRPMDKDSVIAAITTLQRNSRIPMLIAANLENGGKGIVQEGTRIASNMAVAATGDPDYAYQLGKICAEEGKSVGANFAFAPVIDIDYNFRNPITNTRTFGSDPDMVLRCGEAYLKGCQEQDVCVSIKHFPGDGTDERDQHLVTSINSLSPEEWEATYGRNYRYLVDHGAKAVMVGHIAQPQYSKKLNPSLSDADILPASLSPELLKGLLRGSMGFNGLILTDATTMAGFAMAMPRDQAVPKAIENGCDMFLFTKNLEEDVGFMRKGFQDGLLSRERLEEAVRRILALKASLGLHKKDNIPDAKAAERVLGCNEHRQAAREIADRSITLVKEQPGLLPLSPEKQKRVLLYDIEGEANAIGYSRESGLTGQLRGLLEKEGFTVTLFHADGVYEGHQSSYSKMREDYDLILYLCSLATKSNQTVVRIEWQNPMGLNVPIYFKSIPTVFISVENPYHLLDVPRVPTYINTYGVNDYTLELLVDKLLGRSEFVGKSPVDPFCGKWDTKL
ncbi:Beta-N-acetylglucosaminidase/beta-glucosidase [Caprobacter fermentans]|uniref:beta-N-acetylhexosaminidase n=1 Tax=Caproicibacter fermentans TaxID=2576756 RepID=A0A6N8I3B5_9FIRM|nr:glycoside hydrolase family 3 N-terminal domain-containing protein [Caproicibacter fermentans]MVB12438.1 Beta-N-acetylglucosaminidase/beta-glucosidase [Caproicibacter fermentans]